MLEEINLILIPDNKNSTQIIRALKSVQVIHQRTSCRWSYRGLMMEEISDAGKG